MLAGSFHLTYQNSDQHQDKYEYNQTNYRNKEMMHILILSRSLEVFSFFIFINIFP